MPTFDFKCLNCEHIFEFSRPFGSKTKPACPMCRAKKTEKLMSPPMVVFKGEGFYKTDSTKQAAMKETKETKETNEKKETKESSHPQGKPKTEPKKEDGSKPKNPV